MLRSLMTGVTGVRTHQVLLDVTGNNIANVNTAGYKKSNTVFQDMFYQNSAKATAPNEDRGYGGINPQQVGAGVKVGAIETIHTQGNQQYTGNRNDIMVQGEGYFVYETGGGRVFGRAGNCTLDGQSNLVQAGTGYLMQGYQMEPDPTDPTRFIQGSSLGNIKIPVGQKLPAKATSLVGYRCNLDSRVRSYLPTGFTLAGTSQSMTMPIASGGPSTELAVTFNEASVADAGQLLQIHIDNPATPGLPDFDINMFINDIDDKGNPVLAFDATGTTTSTTVINAGETTTYNQETGILIMQNGADKWELDVLGALDYEFISFQDPDEPARTWRVLADFDDPQSRSSDFNLWYTCSDADQTPRRFRAGSGSTSTPPDAPMYFNKDGTFRDYEPTVGQADTHFTFTTTHAGGNATVDLVLQASGNGRGLELFEAETAAPFGPVGDVFGTLSQRIDSIHDSKVDIYDSLGNNYVLEVSWEKLELAPGGTGRWRWRAWLPNEQDTNVSLTPNSGIITFDAAGFITGSGTTAELELGFGAMGADDATVTLDFSGESFGEDAIEGVTQYGSPFTTKAKYQDGYTMGVLRDYGVGGDGVFTGVYSNGQRRPLARVALALFANPNGLEKTGDTAFRVTDNSGLAQIVGPMTGGAGKILGGTLEMSNVDLSEEFVTLIKAQRGFQANARTVTTSDQVLEELVNIKR